MPQNIFRGKITKGNYTKILSASYKRYKHMDLKKLEIHRDIHPSTFRYSLAAMDVSSQQNMSWTTCFFVY